MVVQQTRLDDQTISESVFIQLDAIKDPEIPSVSVRELGMVRSVDVIDGHVSIEMLPTFVGCPALEIIRRNVEGEIAKVEGAQDVTVQFVMTEPWTSDRITDDGIEKLRRFGIALPVREGDKKIRPTCPYCGKGDTNVENLFGPTACRAIFYCNSCGQPFEAMKRV
ncbi:1,2-phenylacetyl-CoA epoxidase subunit PaaD [Alicyclobacillus dauci]|uniref:Phenylacetate-CoA oxygenase subunit PaaJ n=1 Tax=Alicyclobacillus dauci TaxID=1475485 RepID=A0ABY6YYL6_9BACL|nr:1,2-phenylacetyl-CoA epoxidase subunit PaaD [Alicyclobacillus dauci]WAH35174.1 phenylacetate-CoA oxygenase subunit PaaJ [Alicyclobacillus dauci]